VRVTSGKAMFESVSIHDTQATGLSANDARVTYTNLILRYMEIYNAGSETGECFYLQDCLPSAITLGQDWLVRRSVPAPL
jgi:hypothetical protein